MKTLLLILTELMENVPPLHLFFIGLIIHTIILYNTSYIQHTIEYISPRVTQCAPPLDEAKLDWALKMLQNTK